MSDRGDSDVDATEEINVDDSDSRSCGTPHPYIGNNNNVHQERECSNSPTLNGQTNPSKGGGDNNNPPMTRSHPFSISRLLGENGVTSVKSSVDEANGWNNESESINNMSRIDDDRRSWEPELEEKMSSEEKDDDDDTGSASESHITTTNSSAAVHPADFLSPFSRLFPPGSGLIYTGGGVIRVPAHRPPGDNGSPQPNPLPSQALIPWSFQALQHSHQQQATAAGLHRAAAGLLTNFASHPLQVHPHLKDRLAGII